MPSRSPKPAAEATLRTTRGWNPPVHALVNFQRAGVVNFGRASTAKAACSNATPNRIMQTTARNPQSPEGTALSTAVCNSRGYANAQNSKLSPIPKIAASLCFAAGSEATTASREGLGALGTGINEVEGDTSSTTPLYWASKSDISSRTEPVRGSMHSTKPRSIAWITMK